MIGQALPAEHQARTCVAQLRSEGALFRRVIYNAPADVRYPVLGELAKALRLYFWDGLTAVLVRPEVKDKIYAAFAFLPQLRGKQRTKQLYEGWVHKLASREYADELVVLAVALELSIRIVVIPYTPESTIHLWKIPAYGPTGA